eukprot:203043-Prymnesium_polylepis.1
MGSHAASHGGHMPRHMGPHAASHGGHMPAASPSRGLARTSTESRSCRRAPRHPPSATGPPRCARPRMRCCPGAEARAAAATAAPPATWPGARQAWRERGRCGGSEARVAGARQVWRERGRCGGSEA